MEYSLCEYQICREAFFKIIGTSTNQFFSIKKRLNDGITEQNYKQTRLIRKENIGKPKNIQTFGAEYFSEKIYNNASEPSTTDEYSKYAPCFILSKKDTSKYIKYYHIINNAY